MNYSNQQDSKKKIVPGRETGDFMIFNPVDDADNFTKFGRQWMISKQIIDIFLVTWLNSIFCNLFVKKVV